MIKLKKLLSEIFLKEITENTILYHRSFKKYKVGDIIKPGENMSSHYKSFSSEGKEKLLEKYRQENHPNLPPRGKCVYCSVVPKSAFYGKGYLYEVKPRDGEVLVTLASLINQMGKIWERAERSVDRYDPIRFSNEFDNTEDYNEYVKNREEEVMNYAESELEPFFKFYWKGINYGNAFKKDKKWIEVLCHNAEVVAAGGEESFKYFKAGDDVKTKTEIVFDFYPPADLLKNEPDLLAKLKKIYKNVEESDKLYSPWKLTVAAGTKLKLNRVIINQSHFRSYELSDGGDLKSYLSIYRSIGAAPIEGPDIFLDLRRVLWDKNYGKKNAVVKLEDLIEKI